VGVVEVPDPRLQQLADIIHPERIVPAIVEFVDIAGLVAGASQGEGLGNQFLAHIRETDAIVNVVRCFEDDNVIHVANKVDPIADIEVIQTELCLADLATVEKSLQRYTKAAKSGNDKEAAALVGILTRVREVLDQGQPARTLALNDQEKALMKPLCLITAKPAMFVGNVAEDGFENNPFLDRLKRIRRRQNAPVVAICAKIEAELSEMDDADRLEFLKELGQDEPGLNRLIRAGFKLLGLQTYFTAGVKEVRAWTIHIGDTAPQAAGVIHGDFERGFIRAQTIAFDDYIALPGRAGRQRRRQDARRGQGVRRQGRGRAELPVQRLMTLLWHKPAGLPLPEALHLTDDLVRRWFTPDSRSPSRPFPCPSREGAFSSPPAPVSPGHRRVGPDGVHAEHPDRPAFSSERPGHRT
jgi:ribosome-binding ATPase